MQYFDLNIPYLESDKKIPDIKCKKETRFKTIAKSMELGYTGIAYNRTIKGVMSESDRCTIPPFPPSNFPPSFSSSVGFHRRLLGVPESAAFRQYTRLTFVDNSSQSSALNSSNPVLKSYDLVAVRPLNQNAFNHACQHAQVDLIAIDFGEKLPFRLKLPMVNEAIKRGVYFEITYSSLMEDAQVKTQLISNAKLLVQWTKGKNLIVSSAAPSFLQIRGPNDVSNLLSLLGLSYERAKATISKYCRLLIANALRKRYFYKEAIRVEMMPAGAQTDRKEPWIVDYLNWDPLSSGEGDLLLEDLAKSFAESGKVSQTVKAIDFTSLVDSAPSHGLQTSHNGFKMEGRFNPSDNVMDFDSTFKDPKAPKETGKPQIASTSFSSTSSLLDQKGIAAVVSEHSVIPDSPKHSLNIEGFEISSTTILGDLPKPDVLESNISLVGVDESDLQNLFVINAEDLVVSDSIRETTSRDAGLAAESGPIIREEGLLKSADLNHDGMLVDSEQLVSGVSNRPEIGVLQLKHDLVADTDSAGCAEKMMDMDSFVETNCSNGSMVGDLQPLDEVAKEQVSGDLHTDKMMDVDSSIEKNSSDGLVPVDLQRPQEMVTDQERSEEDHNNVITDTKEFQFADAKVQVDSSHHIRDENDLLIEKSMVTEELMMDSRKQAEEFGKAKHQPNNLGSHKVKKSASCQVLRFPFKRLLQVQFKKKDRTSTYKAKKR